MHTNCMKTYGAYCTCNIGFHIHIVPTGAEGAEKNFGVHPHPLLFTPEYPPPPLEVCAGGGMCGTICGTG